MLVFPDNPAWSRQLKGDVRMHYSRPVIRVVDGSLVLREHLGRGIDAVQRLGTVRGFTPEAWQGRLRAGQVQLVEASDIASLVRMLLRLRIDAIYANPEVLHYYLETSTNLGSDRLLLDPELPLAQTAFHASSLKHPELLEAFDRFLVYGAGWSGLRGSRVQAQPGRQGQQDRGRLDGWRRRRVRRVRQCLGPR